MKAYLCSPEAEQRTFVHYKPKRLGRWIRVNVKGGTTPYTAARSGHIFCPAAGFGSAPIAQQLLPISYQRAFMFSLNLVPKARMLSVRANYILGSLQLDTGNQF
jgi:hypothetical protein